MRKITFVIILIISSFISLGQSESFEIVVRRNSIVGKLIYGTISLNGQEIGAAFENSDLRIPTGTYKGLMRYNSGHNFVQSKLGKMSTSGDFLLEVSNVPGNQIPSLRTDILLHPGNLPKHSLGCILLGPAHKGPDGAGQIDQNHPLRKLRLSFYGSDDPNSTPNKDVTIAVVDNIIPGTYYYDGPVTENPGTSAEIVGHFPNVKLTINSTGTGYNGTFSAGDKLHLTISTINIDGKSISFTDHRQAQYSGEFTSDYKQITNFMIKWDLPHYKNVTKLHSPLNKQ